jgi:hypothetical protein
MYYHKQYLNENSRRRLDATFRYLLDVTKKKHERPVITMCLRRYSSRQPPENKPTASPHENLPVVRWLTPAQQEKW